MPGVVSFSGCTRIGTLPGEPCCPAVVSRRLAPPRGDHPKRPPGFRRVPAPAECRRGRRSAHPQRAVRGSSVAEPDRGERARWASRYKLPPIEPGRSSQCHCLSPRNGKPNVSDFQQTVLARPALIEWSRPQQGTTAAAIGVRTKASRRHPEANNPTMSPSARTIGRPMEPLRAGGGGGGGNQFVRARQAEKPRPNILLGEEPRRPARGPCPIATSAQKIISAAPP